MMKHRISKHYTVMIAQTDKEPMVFSIQPIAVWLMAGSLLTLLGFAFFLGWLQGKTTKRASLSMPSLAQSFAPNPVFNQHHPGDSHV